MSGEFSGTDLVPGKARRRAADAHQTSLVEMKTCSAAALPSRVTTACAASIKAAEITLPAPTAS